MNHRRTQRRRQVVFDRMEPRLCFASIGFAEQPIDHVLGGSPEMITADLDGDGDLDLVSGAIGWRANDGQGGFGPTRFVSTERFNVDAIYAGDFDGDGDNDILAAPDGNDAKVAWYENRDGRGNFGPKRELVDSSGRTLALFGADLDDDQDLDIVYAWSTGSSRQLMWLENLGVNGGFLPRLVDGRVGYSVFAEDLDQDGDTDLIAGDTWFENLGGAGRFVQREIDLEISPIRTFVFADVDNNGRWDILTGYVWLEMTEESNRFDLRQRFSSVGHSQDVVVGNIDDDPELELAVVVQENLSSYVFLEDLSPSGSYEGIGRLPKDGGFGWGLVFGDLDADVGDEVIYYSGSNGGTLGSTTWWSIKEGSLTPPTLIHERFERATARVVVDVNGDGLVDIVYADFEDSCFASPLSGCAHTLAWLENLGGRFGPRQTITRTTRESHRQVIELWAPDVDADGDADLLVRDQRGLRWVENVGDARRFAPSQVIGEFNRHDKVLVDDFNRDGHIEILLLSQDLSSADWLAYDHDLDMFERVATQFGRQELNVHRVAAGDINSDGFVDVMLNGQLGDQHVTRWYEYDSQLNMWVLAMEVSINHASIDDLVDMDQDGDLDLLSRSVGVSENRFRWVENHGAGRFEAQHLIASGGAPAEVLWGDFDGDGDPDLLSSDQGAFDFHENVGAGSFLSPRSLGNRGPLMAIGDLDADGDMDVVAGHSYLTWFENRPLGDADGDGRFTSADLQLVFARGEFLDDVPHNSTFIDGDWNGDGEFDEQDIVEAFIAGRYEPEGLPE